MAEIASEFAISMEQLEQYEFRVTLGKEQYPSLRLDEPPPLGKDSGPSASRLLAAAVGHCLSASLLFCAQKGRVPVGPIQTTVKVQVIRNERRRLRIGRIEVEIDPRLAEDQRDHARRCLELFEDFCTVTQSVRAGIPVEVKVKGMRE